MALNRDKFLHPRQAHRKDTPSGSGERLSPIKENASHYPLEELLGVGPLGEALTANSMLTAFNL
jgi:hypothetical protein